LKENKDLVPRPDLIVKLGGSPD